MKSFILPINNCAEISTEIILAAIINIQMRIVRFVGVLSDLFNTNSVSNSPMMKPGIEPIKAIAENMIAHRYTTIAVVNTKKKAFLKVRFSKQEILATIHKKKKEIATLRNTAISTNPIQASMFSSIDLSFVWINTILIIRFREIKTKLILDSQLVKRYFNKKGNMLLF
jgi:hypothetical protein